MTRTRSHFQEHEPFLERFLQLLRFRKIFPYVKNGSNVLDLGCGYNGALLKMLSPDINEGVGIDVSVSKKKVAENMKLVTQKNAKLVQNYFDLATCLAVVEHLENPQKLLKIAYRSLKKGGQLIVTTPSPISKPILEFMAYKLRIISKQEIKDHKRYYNEKELRNLLITSGFKSNKVEIKYFTFGLNTFATAKK